MHNPAGDGIAAITACQRNCVQGDGSTEQTSKYGVCLQDCVDFGDIASILPVAGADVAAPTNPTGAAAVPTGASGTAPSGPGSFGDSTIVTTTTAAETTGAAAAPTGTSSSVIAASHSHSSSATPTPTPAANAAGAVQPGLAGVGLAGLVAAFVV